MGRSPFEKPTYATSTEAQDALEAGDVPALLDLHKSMFGGFRMEADDGDEGGEDEPDDSDEDGDDGSDDGGDEDEDDKSKAKGKKLDPKSKELLDENARRRLANKQLQKQLDEAAKKLKQFEDADKSEVEKITGERDELVTKIDKLAATNRNLALQNAFLQESNHTWHNPKAALKLLDLDGVEIDDEGEVTGLDKAITKLAKENPYLIKSSGGDDEGEGGAPPRSGSPVGKGGKDKQRAALEKKYRLGAS